MEVVSFGGDGDRERSFFCYSEPESRFLYHMIFEKAEYNQSGISIQEGDVVVDVGANTGMFARFAAERGARVVAFEPISELFDVLQKNMADHPDALLVKAACGAKAGATQLGFYRACSLWSGPPAAPLSAAELTEFVRMNVDDEKTRALVEPTVREWNESLVMVPAQVVVLHEELERLNVLGGARRVSLLKIDAEEAEVEIMRSIPSQAWASIDQVAVEVHDTVYDGDRVRETGRVDALVELLKREGFAHVQVERGPPPNYMVRLLNNELSKDAEKKEWKDIKYKSSVMANIYATKKK